MTLHDRANSSQRLADALNRIFRAHGVLWGIIKRGDWELAERAEFFASTKQITGHMLS
jgi:hypothetical protein